LKILFTIDSLGSGGAEASTLELINHFSPTVNVTVSYFYNQHDLRPEYKQAPCRLIYLGLKGRYSFCQGIAKLSRLIGQEQFDLVVTSLYRASIISRIACLLSGVPLIDTMVIESYGKERRKEFKGFRIIKFWMVFCLDRITAFIPTLWISNSHFLATSLGKQLGIMDRKIKVIYRGRQSGIITLWKQPADESIFHFASVGRLYPAKAQHDLICAFNIVHQKFPKTDLTIYGEGPERENLEQLILDYDLGDVIFLPGRKVLAWKQLYTAHCFILPSRYEGFSGALVEALMTGIPVIASDILVNKEAVVHHVNGLLHRVNDVKDLSLKMEEVITHYDVAVMRGQTARQEAIVKYDIKKIASDYEAVLRTCLVNSA
jgi:glycosyltransferase involved in cell wall biosynthesis